MGFSAAVGIGVGMLGVSPTLGHAMVPFGVPQGARDAWYRLGGQRPPWQGAVGTRWGGGGDAGSPSCRPGVSNEWYEFPARPLIASSKSLDELLLLCLAPHARDSWHGCAAG